MVTIMMLAAALAAQASPRRVRASEAELSATFFASTCVDRHRSQG
jgi:hypothetical protein